MTGPEYGSICIFTVECNHTDGTGIYPGRCLQLPLPENIVLSKGEQLPYRRCVLWIVLHCEYADTLLHKPRLMGFVEGKKNI